MLLYSDKVLGKNLIKLQYEKCVMVIDGNLPLGIIANTAAGHFRASSHGGNITGPTV